MTERARDSDRSGCDDDSTMPRAELYPLTYSTAFLGIAALVTIRSNTDDLFDENVIEYATSVLELIQRQPETVKNLSAEEIEIMGPHLIDNAASWLNDA